MLDTFILDNKIGSPTQCQYIRVAAKDNWTADTDPTPADFDGYGPGSLWFNHASPGSGVGTLWVCNAINGNQAVWTKSGGSSGGGGLQFSDGTPFVFQLNQDNTVSIVWS